MFLKFSQITIFYFLLLSQVNGAESGGMPQLNPEFWFSQIFWLIITFGFMFVVLSKLVLPKISENLETRKAQISENIESTKAADSFLERPTFLNTASLSVDLVVVLSIIKNYM